MDQPPDKANNTSAIWWLALVVGAAALFGIMAGLCF